MICLIGGSVVLGIVALREALNRMSYNTLKRGYDELYQKCGDLETKYWKLWNTRNMNQSKIDRIQEILDAE